MPAGGKKISNLRVEDSGVNFVPVFLSVFQSCFLPNLDSKKGKWARK
jgi:hypothetical protein